MLKLKIMCLGTELFRVELENIRRIEIESFSINVQTSIETLFKLVELNYLTPNYEVGGSL